MGLRLRPLLGIWMVIAISTSVAARANLEEKCLEYVVSGKLPAPHYVKAYTRFSKIPLPELRQIFQRSAFAFLNTWESNPFSAFPMKARFMLAIFAVRSETQNLFHHAADPVLGWTLFDLAMAMRQEQLQQGGLKCVDVVACRVLQNIFPLAFRDDPEAQQYRAFSKRALCRYREQINDELESAFRWKFLSPVERDALVAYLSQISGMRFGLSTLRRKIGSFLSDPPGEP